MECRTCAYNYGLSTSLYERKTMKRKEVEDVLGGKEAWENVDKTSGKQDDENQVDVIRDWPPNVGDHHPADSTTVQCPRDDCDGSEAFFYQVQIRSADEPMTTFYKVLLPGVDSGHG